MKATFQPAGGSCFLYIDQSLANTTLSISATVQEVKKTLYSLPGKQRKLFRIIERKELDKMGVDSSAILALAAVQGIVFSGSTGGEQLTAIKGGHHGYDPNLPEMYTGFIATGTGISKGAIIPQICVTDIAPLIAKLLNLEFNAIDGILLPEILRQ